MKILFVASEVDPFIKTGGLADVAGGLPRALHAGGHEIVIVLPAYPALIEGKDFQPQAEISLSASQSAQLFTTHLPHSSIPVWLIHLPGLFDRSGHPYLDAQGQPWPDNAQRFGRFCQAVAMLCLDPTIMQWQADIVHCNDWQTGLIPAWLNDNGQRPACVFTIHNLAYQGVFDLDDFEQLELPAAWWDYRALEFYGQFSFIKGGLVYADRINTVSPTYAQEIQTPEFGCGLELLLQHRAQRLCGILNGIDEKKWNPGQDKLIAAHYNWRRMENKAHNKRALQARMGLPENATLPIIACISRLVEQKGIDLIIESLPEMFTLPCQIVLLGNGEKRFELALQRLAARYPQQLSLCLGFDEQLAHLIEAGADLFLMPSRFEPCGLNQLYSQRYGTVPLVRPVGGLADTVVAVTPESVANHSATGFYIDEITTKALLATVQLALAYYTDKVIWQQIQHTGMRRDFSWQARAQEYVTLYQMALADRQRVAINY
jgi:starch synthase